LDDTESVYKFVIDELKYKPEQIIVIGRSLGSSPSLYLASWCQVRAVILISAFLSVKAVMKDRNWSSFTFLANGSFDNMEYLNNV